MRSEDEIRQMKSAKKTEEYNRHKSYDEGVRDGWIHCLNWILED